MIIDDLIVLGRAVPDRIKNGRITICTAGYSSTHGFIRIYPTRLDSPLTRWNIVSVPVERDNRDHRLESWKIEGSKSEWLRLSRKIKIVDNFSPRKRLNLIANLTDDCVQLIREEGRSLGIIKPTIEKTYFAERRGYDKGIQQTLYGEEATKTIKNYHYQPRIRFKCSKCKTVMGWHDQQVLEWGVYEWIRKHPNNINEVWENLLLYSKKYEIYLLEGNLFLHPNRYMIISVIRLQKGKITKPLFPYKKVGVINNS